MEISVKEQEERIESYKSEISRKPTSNLLKHLDRREKSLAYHKQLLQEILGRKRKPLPIHYWNIKRNEKMIKALCSEICLRYNGDPNQMSLFPKEKTVLNK